MTEREAAEKLKNMRLFMQLEDNKNECKFAEDDYKANEMAIQALEKQMPKPPEPWHGILRCASCGVVHIYFDRYCPTCGQRLE